VASVPSNRFVVDRGWVRYETREGSFGFGAKARCLAMALTPAAQVASAQWTQGRIGSEGVAWIAPRSAQQAWAVGVIWVVLTLAFEFLAGHYVFHNAWSRLLEDYNVVRGRIWILVLMTTLVSPRLCASLRNLSLTR
jgi:hypothetical protein